MSRIQKEMYEAACDMHRLGVMDHATFQKIADRYIAAPEKMKPEEIKELRESLEVSQPVFAKFLNVKPVTVKKWESGANRPGSAALKLLQIVKTKGLEPLRL